MMSSQQFGATADGERGLAPHRDGDFQATLLGMAGHDLRQPLQVIQSAYEWLGSRVMTMPERSRLERGERAIAKLTEQLDRLVGALRLYEHTKSITLSPTALAPLFDGIASDNREAAIEKGVELRISPTTASVMSHPVLLDGILRNLVRNAIKYTEPGGAHTARLPAVRDRAADRYLRYRHWNRAGAPVEDFRCVCAARLDPPRRPRDRTIRR